MKKNILELIPKLTRQEKQWILFALKPAWMFSINENEEDEPNLPDLPHNFSKADIMLFDVSKVRHAFYTHIKRLNGDGEWCLSFIELCQKLDEYHKEGPSLFEALRPPFDVPLA